MSEQRVTTLVVEVAGRKSNLDAVLQDLQRELQAAAGGAERAERAIGGGLAQGSQKAAREALQLAQAAQRVATEQQRTAATAARAAQEQTKVAAAQARAAAEGQRLALSQQRVATEAQRTAAATARAEQAALRLAQAQERAARGGGSGLSSLTSAVGGLNAALGAVGLGLGAQQLLAYGGAAIQSANQLEQTSAVMRQLAGSKERYDQIVRLATANQRLFGGSLNDNLTPLNALLQLANRTGAELDNLNQTTQLLLASAPGKSFGDASFGLSEFLGNNGAEAALSLADQFNLPKKALAELAAEGVSAEQRLAGLQALLAQQGVTAETLAARLNTTAATYDQLGASFANLQTQLGGLIANGLQPAATGLNQVAIGAGEVLAILSGGTGQIGAAQQQIAATAGSYEEYRQRAEAARAAAQAHVDQIAAGLGPLGGFAGALVGAITNTEILSEAEYQAAVAAAEQAAATDVAAASQDNAASASQGYADAIGVSTDALAENLARTVEGQLQTDILAQAQGRLASLGTQVQAGLLTAAQGAAQLAAQYGIASGEALRLINLQATLARTKVVADAGFAGVPEAYLGAAVGGRARGATIGPSSTVLSQIAAETKVAQAQYQQAIRDYEAAERQTARGAGRAASGAGRAGNAAATREAEQLRKLQEQRLRDQERIHAQLEELDSDHYDRLLAIQAEYERKTLEQQRSNQATSRRSRFSFYSELTSAEIPQGVADGLSAQYEEAFAEAQRLSQEGKAKLGADYLALKQEQISAELQFQQDLAKAQEAGNKAEVARLEALAKLRRDAEQAELNNLLGEGDANVTRRDEALGDEGQRYAEQQAEIAGAAETAAQRKITAAEKSAEAVDLETAALQRQADLLATLNQQRLAGGLPAGASTPATPAAPAIVAPQQAPPAEPGGPQPVLDVAAVAALTSLAAALDRGLGDLKRAIDGINARAPFVTE